MRIRHNLISNRLRGAILLIGFLVLPFEAQAAADYTQDASCEAAYRFDGSASDETANGHHGTLQGPISVSGLYGNAYEFDGGNDYIDIGSFDPSVGDMTLVMWINWYGDNGSHDGLIGKRDSWGVNGMRWQLVRNYVVDNMRFERKNDYDSINVDIPSTNTWVHVALVHDANGVDKLYFDGVYAGERTSLNFGTKLDAGVVIGNVNAGNTVEGFNGKIDEVGIFSRALTPTEIQEIMDHGLKGDQNLGSVPAAPTNLAAIENAGDVDLTWTDNSSDEDGFKIYRKLDSDPSFTLHQTINTTNTQATTDTTGLSAGNTYEYKVVAFNAAGDSVDSNVTTVTMPACNNFTDYTQDVNCVGAWLYESGSSSDSSSYQSANSINGSPAMVLGKYGDALSFNGTNDSIDLNQPSHLKITGSMTVMSWVKHSEANDNFRFIAKQGGGGARCWSLNLENANPDFLSFQISETGNDIIACADEDLTSIPSVDEWYHVVGVYDAVNQMMKLYKNGQLIEEKATGVPSSQFDNSLDANIAFRISNIYFEGEMDETAIFDRVLSQAEIQEIMDHGLKGDQNLGNTPLASTNLTAQLIGQDVMLSWTDNSSDEDGFKIYRQTNGAGGFTEVGDTLSGNIESFLDDAITIGDSYEYYVVAYHQTATSQNSETISIATINLEPTADFSYSINGQTVSFTGAVSSDPNGDVLTYLWDFGDGSSPTYETESNPSHTYTLNTANNASDSLLLLHADDFVDAMGNHSPNSNGVSVNTIDKQFGAGAFSFNGSNAISIGSSPDWDVLADDFTIDFWFKPTAAFFDGMTLLSHYLDPNNFWKIEFYGASGEHLRFTSKQNGAGYLYILADNHAIPTNQWHHLTFVRNGTEADVYLNGTSIYTNKGNLTAGVPDFDGTFYLGSYGATGYFTGLIDEFRYVRSAKYTQNFTPPTAPYEENPQTSFDVTLTVNDGVLTDDFTQTIDLDPNASSTIDLLDYTESVNSINTVLDYQYYDDQINAGIKAFGTTTGLEYQFTLLEEDGTTVIGTPQSFSPTDTFTIPTANTNYGHYKIKVEARNPQLDVDEEVKDIFIYRKPLLP